MITRKDIDESKVLHLHVHNSFSFKDGVGAPHKRVEWAVDNNKVGVATTNHGNIADWLAIYKGAKSAGIKPLLGCEFYFKRGSAELDEALLAEKPNDKQKAIKRKYKKGMNHATMFAANIAGYHNMLKMHNDAWMNRYYFRPIVSDLSVEANNEGVICLSGCTSGEINKVILSKHYLQSEDRPNDIKNIIKAKVKLMASVFKTNNIEKLQDSTDINTFDIDYYSEKQKQEGKVKFDQEEYIAFAKSEIEKMDADSIAHADQEIDGLIDWWKAQFGKNFYFEIMTIDYDDQKIVNEALIKLSKEKDVPLVLTNDSHYLTAAESKVQELQMLSDQSKTFEDLKNDIDGSIWTIQSEDLYYKTIDELYDAWEKIHKSDVFTEEVFWEGIYNITKIVDSIEQFEIDTAIKMPKLYDDGYKVLVGKIMEGLKNRDITVSKLGSDLFDKYKKQIKVELELIKEKNYSDYFLMVEDITSWARDNYGKWAVGPGRGCFVPGSQVRLTDDSFKNVEDMKYGEEVITAYGNKQKAEALYKYDIEETISKINLKNGDSIECTKDHKILVVKKGIERHINNTIWIEASKLEPGDCLIKGV